MDGLMNRSRGLAEGVVVMVCPVLLALALDKIDLKVYGRRNFMAMLTMAGIALISGICPVLVCCFSERFEGVINKAYPPPVTASLATLSSSCLLILACFIAKIIVSKKILIAVGSLCGTFFLVRTVFYNLRMKREDYNEEIHAILDESYEFLTGITGILFLGLDGLAIASHDNQMLQKGGGAVGTVSFIVCALGICLMYFGMTPPPHFTKKSYIVGFTLILDILMAVGTFVLLMVVMFQLIGIPALVICTAPAIIMVDLVYRVTIGGPENIHQCRPASLELTRVTFTGFFAVSITAIGNTSPSMLTNSFLLFAAVAIVFGILWRFLTKSQMSCLTSVDLAARVPSSAKLASLCTHFCIVIATILFLAMAGTARGK